MYRFLLPLAIAAACLPCAAQTITSNQPFAGDLRQRASIAGETLAPLTLNTALDRTRSANPALSAAHEGFNAQDGAVLQVGLRPNHAIDINVLDTRRETRETIVQLSQAIELGNKRAQRLSAAEKNRDAAAAERNAKWLEIRADVTKAFYDVLVAQEQVTLSDESVANAQRATTTASNRVVAGKISPVEETRARVAETAIRLELLQAKSDLATLRLVVTMALVCSYNFDASVASWRTSGWSTLDEAK